MKIHFKSLCFAVAAMVTAGTLGSQSAYATKVLMIDFGATTATTGPPNALINSPYHTVNPSFTDTSWVKRSALGTSSPTYYSDGTTAWSGIVDIGMTTTSNTIVDLSTNPTGNSGLGSKTSTGIYDGTSVGKDAIYNGSAGQAYAVGAQITGLAPGTYDVYIAARNTNATAATKFTMYAASAATGNFDYSSYASGTVAYADENASITSWVVGANYVNIPNITLTADQVLNIASASTATSGPDRGFLNLVQIVQVPEPGSFALLLCGALGFVRLRRRK